MNGTIRRYFKDELVIVGLLLDTVRLDSIFHVADRGIDRIDWNYIDISAELTVLVGSDVTTAHLLIVRSICIEAFASK